ncbi:hypothetical protein [Tautonia marina]|uniref:hypothetical protein n=1 Tax=Tautonia marina TaxID=2653855 RepID=UPI001260B338|nr:hypothetical protein [Tautonia marina]
MIDDDPDDFGRPGAPGVRVSAGDDDPTPVALWYGTFDVILRGLHDLWWCDRRIKRLKLLSDWIADRGLFDPEVGRSVLNDPAETLAAFRLLRDRFARGPTEPGDEVDAALVALIRCLTEAIAHDQPVVWDRI